MKLKAWDSGAISDSGFFPEVRDWVIRPLEVGFDKGTYSVIEYSISSDQHDEVGSIHVEFDVGGPEQGRAISMLDFDRGSRNVQRIKPASFRIEGFNDSVEGSWKSLRDVPKILSKAKAWGKKKMDKLKADVSRLAGRGWEIDWVFDGIAARYVGIQGPLTMTVDFDDASDALSGGEGEAYVSFEQDWDPVGGASGGYKKKFSYSGARDIVKILKKAEETFKKLAQQ